MGNQLLFRSVLQMSNWLLLGIDIYRLL